MNNSLVTLSGITVHRGKKQVLCVDHLELERGEILAVIGPNGSGKSTLLQVFSFLLPISSGSIVFDGENLGASRPSLATRRRVAMTLQTPLLTDSSVENNVAMGLRFRSLDSKEIDRRVSLWLERFGVSHLRHRRARSLSGGEAQRVSLARSMAIEPDLMLLDEPLASLDAPTRATLLDDLETILRETQMTTVFVTHDRNEALALGDRVAVLIDGNLAQLGTKEDVFNEPANEAVANFVGVDTIARGFVERQFEGLAVVHINDVDVEVASDFPVGTQVVLFLRPEEVVLSLRGDRAPSSMRNNLPGVVTRCQPIGSQYRVEVDCGFPVVALITKQSQQELGLTKGLQVIASFKASAVHLIRHREKAGSKLPQSSAKEAI